MTKPATNPATSLITEEQANRIIELLEQLLAHIDHDVIRVIVDQLPGDHRGDEE